MTTDVETGKLKNCIENAHEEPVYKLLCLDTNKIVTGIFFFILCFEMCSQTINLQDLISDK